MNYEKLETIRKRSSALRLLRAETMPLIASFLHGAFIVPSRRSIGLAEIEGLLEERILSLKQIYGDELFPRSARQYLDEWAHSDSGYLRKYYVIGSDDPHFDLSPGTERALEWLRGSLEERAFVGTESRLLTLFQQLREFVKLSERDPAARLKELEQDRSRLDQEIHRTRNGEFSSLSDVQAKERFYQIEETARRLLGDFRQVEENFRELDTQTRERIALSEGARGQVLEDVFSEHDMIRESEQGRSFRAFWDFLMSSSRQEELDSLIAKTYARDEIERMSPDLFLREIRFALVEAADKVYRTNSRLIEQLRRFLDDRARIENRRIMALIRAIEKSALDLKGVITSRVELTELSDLRPSFDLAMSRGMFIPPQNPIVTEESLTEGESETDVSALFDQVVVDERELRRNVQEALQACAQITLKDLLVKFPLRNGVAEIVGYLQLASRDKKSLIDDGSIDEILVPKKTDNSEKIVKTPRVIFTR